MKQINLFLFVLISLAMVTCKHDHDHEHQHEHEHEHEECEELPNYKNYTVDFFSTHKDFVINPTIFETVTEQVLVRPAYQVGASFETISEQVLVKESSLRHAIFDKKTIHLVANSEKDSIAKIDCYHFFEAADIIEVEVPAEYSTRIYYSLLVQGTGAEIPAEYATITRQIVFSDSEIVSNTEEQVFTRVGFRVLENQSIQEYLANQFSLHDVMGCVEGNGYRVN